MYASSMQEAETNLSHLLNGEEVKNNKKLEKHLKDFWGTREEWCLAYRSDIITRGNNTNNYCESSIQIFKDIVLQRCKVFNMCALVDFIAKTFETYHKKRLIHFANGRARYLRLAYEKFVQECENIEYIEHVEDNTSLNRRQILISLIPTQQLATAHMELGTCELVNTSVLLNKNSAFI